jgi:hypothetical protein
MNISEALNAAADQIEQYPESYRFNNSTIPKDGGQGCMLGFFGKVAGLPVGLSVDTLSFAVLGRPACQFYEEVAQLNYGATDSDIVNHAHLAAAGMRRAAKTYEGIPQDVREIFNAKAAQVPYPPLSAEFYVYLAHGAAVANMYPFRPFGASPVIA